MRRLKGLNGPKPLVVGKYADVNQRMRRLLVEMADACAVAKWQEMNYRNEATALARLKLHFRRIVGLACHKSQARLLLDRLNNLDGGAQRQKAFQRKSNNGWDETNQDDWMICVLMRRPCACCLISSSDSLHSAECHYF